MYFNIDKKYINTIYYHRLHRSIDQIMNKLQALYTSGDFSDFKFIDSEGNTLNVHSLILRISSPFFKTFFASQVQGDKSTMKVKYIYPVELIVKSFYNNDFIIPSYPSVDEFVELANLAKMWEVGDKILDQIFNKILSMLHKLMWQIIPLIELGYIFQDMPDRMTDGYDGYGIRKWSGEILWVT